MPDEAHQCPKCKGEMKAGFLLPEMGHPVNWHAGTVVRGWFGFSGSENVQHQLYTFRCDECGFIEFYAK